MEGVAYLLTWDNFLFIPWLPCVVLVWKKNPFSAESFPRTNLSLWFFWVIQNCTLPSVETEYKYAWCRVNITRAILSTSLSWKEWVSLLSYDCTNNKNISSKSVSQVQNHTPTFMFKIFYSHFGKLSGAWSNPGIKMLVMFMSLWYFNIAATRCFC